MLRATLEASRAWNDEAERQVVYQQLNEVATVREQITRFWTRMLNEGLAAERTFVTSLEALNDAWEGDGGPPPSLKTVLGGLVDEGTLVFEDALRREGARQRQRTSAVSWLGSLALTPLQWGWEALVGGAEPVRDEDRLRGRLVHVPLARQCLAAMAAERERGTIVPVAWLARDWGLDSSDVELLGMLSARDEEPALVLFTPAGGGGVRFAKLGGRPAEQDAGVAALVLAEHTLNEQCARLVSRTRELQSGIVEALARASASGNASEKALALSLLKQRRAVERTLDQQLGALGNVTSLKSSIEQAQSSAEALAALAAGTASLRAANALTADAAATLEDMREAIVDSEHVQRLLGSAGAADDDAADVDALSAELDAMLRVDSQAALAIASLPVVPVPAPVPSEPGARLAQPATADEPGQGIDAAHSPEQASRPGAEAKHAHARAAVVVAQ